MPDLNDDLFNDGGTDDGDSSDDGASQSGNPSTQGDKSKSTDKRISDLQSKADKETARANKAEARIAALEKLIKGDAEGGSGSADHPAGQPDPAANATLTFMLDFAKGLAFQQHPKLAEYGLSAADLTGTTPAEIAASATALVGRFEKMETQIRNKVLADNGIAPEIDQASSPRTPNRDFSKMPSEDFNKLLDTVLKGGRV